MSRVFNEHAVTRQRAPRRRDKAYLNWLHEGIPCLACLIEGRVHGLYPLEAAHQKMGIAAKGWTEGGGGVRTHDDRCAILCAWHHRLAPDACDNGQRRFWDRLRIGDDVADLCADLYAAFQAGESGLAVVLRYAGRARCTATPSTT